MSRTEKILEFMRQEPGRSWSASEVSVHLDCAPNQAADAMRRMLKEGHLLRVDAGVYCLASRFERPAEATPEQESPPVPPQVTPEARDAFLGVMQTIGHPVHGTVIVARLRRSVPDFDLTHLGAVAAELRADGKIVRHSDGKYALPAWGKR
ncbi:hypothetical protein WDJ50_02690 [Deinococcus sp. VB142]|uniref:Uncharacterized protein n=1 Tax=Deinococcus sp. VB142 TaxID=3112952 RepID=A0AAU6Q353_9DEIO